VIRVYVPGKRTLRISGKKKRNAGICETGINEA
jgi:hypothetical protein